jgi:hypothetical protein
MLDPESPERARAEALLGIAYLDLREPGKARELQAHVHSILRTHPQLSGQYLRPVQTLAERLKAN